VSPPNTFVDLKAGCGGPASRVLGRNAILVAIFAFGFYSLNLQTVDGLLLVVVVVVVFVFKIKFLNVTLKKSK
jgi:hypothetical protein